jgi:hypothetical protein
MKAISIAAYERGFVVLYEETRSSLREQSLREDINTKIEDKEVILCMSDSLFSYDGDVRFTNHCYNDKILENLFVISCDSYQGKLASYDVYMDSGIANVPFLRRYCTDCIKNVTN